MCLYKVGFVTLQLLAMMLALQLPARTQSRTVMRQELIVVAQPVVAAILESTALWMAIVRATSATTPP
jgi:hypothetical protein